MMDLGGARRWGLGLAIVMLSGCFEGARGLPCKTDAHCGPLACVDGVCGDPADGDADGHTCVYDTNCGAAKCIAGSCRTPADDNAVVQVAAGMGHTCMIVASGQMRCLGSNMWYQLGVARPPENSCETVAVDLGPRAEGLSVVGIAMGGESDTYEHYGYTCAQLSNGKAMCWGTGSYLDLDGVTKIGGWLGNEATDTVQPASAADFVPLKADVKRIAAGQLYTCAISSDPADALLCWGLSGDNRLGYDAEDENIGDEKDEMLRLKPFLTDVVEVAAGPHHACARTAETVWCWGENSAGEVGVSGVAPLRVDIVELGHLKAGSATAVAAGRYHTCVVVEEDSVRCWGSNERGQLGAGAPVGDNRPDAVTVEDLELGEDERIAQLVAGHKHNCVLVTGAGGSARVACWGDNGKSQLGYYAEHDLETHPVEVDVGASDDPPIQISAHLGEYTCAVLASGELWCWGNNLNGQMGCTEDTALSVPVQVPL